MGFELETPNGTVAVELAGPDPATSPGVLLLHANPGDHRDFHTVAAELATSRAVAALDWPGYGRSTVLHPAELTVDDLADTAVAIADALAAKGFRQLSIIGNSVGGYAAVRLAQQRPNLIDNVVLVQPAGFTPTGPLAAAVCRIMGSPTIARRAIAPSARLYLGPRRTPEQHDIYHRATRIPQDPIRLAAYCALWRSLADPRRNLVAEAPLLPQTRVQVVWGTRDPINPWLLNKRGVTRALPHATIAPLPTRHEPFNENPKLFLNTVLPFLTHPASPA